MHISMHISEAGIDLIKHYEGLRLEAYPDIAGKWTIGWGHAGALPCDRITVEEAERLLARDIAAAESGVLALLEEMPVTQGQFDALVSFVFNLGVKRLMRSTLLKKLKAGDREGAADEFPKWTMAGGVRMPGLVARRRAERAIFLGIDDAMGVA